MKILDDKTIYTIQHEKQELKNLWFFCNNYLIMNPDKEGDIYFETAKKFCDDFSFVVR